MRDVFSTPQITVRQNDFERQIRFLAQHYTVISLMEFLETRLRHEALRPKTAIVTFDDGWRDNYLYAFPVLKKYGVPATFFLTTSFIATDKVFWQEKTRFLRARLHDRLRHDTQKLSARLGKLPPEIRDVVTAQGVEDADRRLIGKLKGMDREARQEVMTILAELLGFPEFPKAANAFLTWEEVREMKKFDCDFGSHTKNHKLLPQVSSEEIAEELEGSKRKIEEELKIPVETFAYPNGDHNARVVNQVRACNYKLAVTTTPGINTARTDLHRLKRMNMRADRFTGPTGAFSDAIFAASLAGCL